MALLFVQKPHRYSELQTIHHFNHNIKLTSKSGVPPRGQMIFQTIIRSIIASPPITEWPTQFTIFCNSLSLNTIALLFFNNELQNKITSPLYFVCFLFFSLTIQVPHTIPIQNIHTKSRLFCRTATDMNPPFRKPSPLNERNSGANCAREPFEWASRRQLNGWARICPRYRAAENREKSHYCMLWPPFVASRRRERGECTAERERERVMFLCDAGTNKIPL